MFDRTHTSIPTHLRTDTLYKQLFGIRGPQTEYFQETFKIGFYDHNLLSNFLWYFKESTRNLNITYRIFPLAYIRFIILKVLFMVNFFLQLILSLSMYKYYINVYVKGFLPGLSKWVSDPNSLMCVWPHSLGNRSNKLCIAKSSRLQTLLHLFSVVPVLSFRWLNLY